jgi:hypothetical protein
MPYSCEVYLDGRPLPVNPNPTWNGYSTGHWDGDTLVIETNGIRDDMWFDIHVETRRPHQSGWRSSSQLSGHRHRQLCQ